jgi:thiamine-monophosphate kinase
MANSRAIPGEQALIAALRTRTGHSGPAAGVRLGIGDDCAILRPPRGHQIVVTTDFSLETVHFRRDWHSPESAGHRCLARGLSDLAAMGAIPLAAFLSLALPPELLAGKPSWRDHFLAGFLALADRCHVPLAGGDTAQSPRHPSARKANSGHALADIVLLGSAPPRELLLRSGARAGDAIYATGALGGAAAELGLLTKNPHRFRRIKNASSETPHPHLFPEPRIAVGRWLAKNHRATAAIDISDGLSTDLHHLCAESNLAAVLDTSAIPIHTLAQGRLDLALHGGEDYELLFTAAPTTRIPRRIAGVPVTRIGEMRRKAARQPPVVLRTILSGKPREKALAPRGWQHYK